MKTQFVFRRIVFVMLVLVLLCAAAAAYADGVPAAGSVVTFGHYEQDGNTENGPEEIQWIVLDTDGDRVFLLSKYGLDAKQYNVKYTRVTWETCSLRQWLNSTFLDSAFTAEEQEEIFLTDVDNSPEQTYENGDNAEARVAPTAFAKGRRAWSKRELKTADGDYAGRWWLRSMGRHPNRAAHVHSTGALRDSHVTSYNHLFGVMTVRPALWVKAEAVSGK